MCTDLSSNNHIHTPTHTHILTHSKTLIIVKIEWNNSSFYAHDLTRMRFVLVAVNAMNLFTVNEYNFLSWYFLLFPYLTITHFNLIHFFIQFQNDKFQKTKKKTKNKCRQTHSIWDSFDCSGRPDSLSCSDKAIRFVFYCGHLFNHLKHCRMSACWLQCYSSFIRWLECRSLET